MDGACNLPILPSKETDIISECESWYARWDRYPVNPGHLLIATFRHIPFYFETTQEEREALVTFINYCKSLLDEKFHPDGYNIGMNVGTAAGQTVMHVHVHLIPRYKGDIENPTGGVRGVIPRRRIYLKHLH